MQNMKLYAAEALGTLLLTLVVRLAIGSHLPLPTPLLAGLTLGILVYALGPISGAHVNPAVTIGLLGVRRIGVIDAVLYVVSQFLGATVGGIVGTMMLGSSAPLPVGDSVGVGVGEAVGAAFLLLGVTSVVFGKTPSDASGLTIGTTLALGALTASTLSAGILNPAVALGIGSLSFAYLLGPVVGAVVMTQAYRWLTA